MRTPEFVKVVRAPPPSGGDTGSDTLTLVLGDIVLVKTRVPPVGVADGATGAYDAALVDELPMTGVRGIAVARRAIAPPAAGGSGDHDASAAVANPTGRPWLALPAGAYVALVDTSDTAVWGAEHRGTIGAVRAEDLEVLVARNAVEAFELSASEGDDDPGAIDEELRAMEAEG
jgi:hypothetical protein